MASWFLAATHSLTARPVLSKLRIARKISFAAASSVGKEPLAFNVFRSTRFSDSTAFVTGMPSVVLMSGRVLQDLAYAASVRDGGTGSTKVRAGRCTQ